MANPHSLFTTPTRQPISQRLPIGPTPRQRSESTNSRSLHPQQHTRSPSTTTTTTATAGTVRARLYQIDDFSPSSPTTSTFSGIGGASYVGPSNTTAAAFLRPARPGQGAAPYPSLSAPRPPSRLSTDSRRRSGPRPLGDRLSAAYSLDSHPDEPDEYSLRRLSSIDAEPEAQQPYGTSLSPSQLRNGGGTTKSREPLLPLSRKDTKDSVFGQSTGPNAGMRDSLDRLFRRLSGSADVPTTTINIPSPPPTTGALEKHAEADEADTQSTQLSSPRTSAQKHSLSLAHARVGEPGTPTGSFTVVTDAAPAHPSARRGRKSPQEALSAVPRMDVRGRPVRKYTVHPSRNKFFFGGRLLTGGDAPWAFIGSLVLLFGLAGTWFGTTCVWWARHESVAVAAVGGYMCLLTASTMLATALRDPGILPRDLDPDPPCSSVASGGSGARVPMPRDLKVRKGMVRVKYCATCRMYRPPRSSHCKMCDNCVEGCDHHCQWVNNCVGHRNYTTFFAFLISAVLTLALVISTSAIHIYFLTSREGMSFAHALNAGAGSAVVFSIGVVIVWPITALALYHVRLLLLNVTTIEQIRTQAHKTLVPGPPPPNPFTHGSWYRNLANVLCRPEGYSWLDSTAVVTDDKREVNPGLRDGLQQPEEAGGTGATTTSAI